MSVTIRPYLGGDQWEVDVRITFPDGREYRERKKAPVTGKSAALRWAQDRERYLLREGPPRRDETVQKEVETLRAFGPRFVDGYARANQHKPSGIAAKATILTRHLYPAFGEKALNAITTEDVQQFKVRLRNDKKSAKTVNNILTVLNTLLRTAVDWGVIESKPCVVRLLKVGKPVMAFHDFEEFERLAESARVQSENGYLAVLAAGEAGLRCGEIIGLLRVPQILITPFPEILITFP